MASFWGPPHKLPKTVRFPKVPHKEFNSARPTSIFRFLAFLALRSFHFGFFGLVFLFILAFWAFISFHFVLFGPSFPFILSFLALSSFHLGLFGLHFLSFFAFWWLASGPPPTSCQKRSVFPRSHIKNLTAPGRAQFSDFWPFGNSFPFILAFLVLFSFYFGLLGLHFLSFWPFGNSFPFILAFLVLFSFHFGLLGRQFLSLLPFGGVAKTGPRSVQGPGGFDVLFYDGMRRVQGPGGFNVLFYDGMRRVQGLGGSYSMKA